MIDEPKLDLAFVQAPRCDGCGEPMVKYDATRWICVSDECEQNTTPVKVDGTYAIFDALRSVQAWMKGYL